MDAIRWPTNDKDWCAWYRRLDAKFGTTPTSPLHHNNRCSIHKEH